MALELRVMTWMMAKNCVLCEHMIHTFITLCIYRDIELTKVILIKSGLSIDVDSWFYVGFKYDGNSIIAQSKKWAHILDIETESESIRIDPEYEIECSRYVDIECNLLFTSSVYGHVKGSTFKLKFDMPDFTWPDTTRPDIKSFKISPERTGRRYAGFCMGSGKLLLFDLLTLKVVQIYQFYQIKLDGFEWNPVQNEIVTVDKSGNLHVWRYEEESAEFLSA
ncbi:unnamed protein product [Caenorhabditis bovis]|uniref:Uncharacterized protein n=1 Tax=Caenorhabditis bovis TaxID=2654633 RepID=A0A8S1EDC8_9PELO|nr:unnamed protein product [Caenorhabditis bovis]